jgi:hypothetical protein
MRRRGKDDAGRQARAVPLHPMQLVVLEECAQARALDRRSFLCCCRQAKRAVNFVRTTWSRCRAPGFSKAPCHTALGALAPDSNCRGHHPTNSDEHSEAWRGVITDHCTAVRDDGWYLSDCRTSETLLILASHADKGG